MSTVCVREPVPSLDSPPRESTDPADFDQVVSANWEMWVQWVFNRLRDRSTRYRPANWGDAEDIIQDILGQASQYLHCYRPGGAPLSAWLMGWIKIHFRQNRRGLAYDPAKKRPVLRFVGDEKLPNIGGHYWPDDDRRFPVDREAVRNAVDGLSPPYRDTITLRHFQGLNMREAGERRGVSRQRIHQVLRQGYDKLRVSLDSLAPDPA